MGVADEVREQEPEETFTLPSKLFLLGFFLMFVGIIVLVVAALSQGNVDFSGVVAVFVGPVPIILAAGPYAPFLIVLAVVLTIIGFVVFFLMQRVAVRL